MRTRVKVLLAARVRVGERASDGSVGSGDNVKSGLADTDGTGMSLPRDTEVSELWYVIDSETVGVKVLGRTGQTSGMLVARARAGRTSSPSSIISALMSLGK